MILNTIKRIGALALCLAVVGCAGQGGVRSVSPSDIGFGGLEHYRSAARDGTVRLVVAGPLFARDPAARDDRINRALQTIHTNIPAQFAASPDTDGFWDPRIVIVFSPRDGAGVSRICDRDIDPAAMAGEQLGDQLKVHAAFCVRSSARTWTRVSAPVPQSVDDPVFHDIVQRIGFDLIPPLRLRGSQNDCRSRVCN